MRLNRIQEGLQVINSKLCFKTVNTNSTLFGAVKLDSVLFQKHLQPFAAFYGTSFNI